MPVRIITTVIITIILTIIRKLSATMYVSQNNPKIFVIKNIILTKLGLEASKGKFPKGIKQKLLKSLIDSQIPSN